MQDLNKKGNGKDIKSYIRFQTLKNVYKFDTWEQH